MHIYIAWVSLEEDTAGTWVENFSCNFSWRTKPQHSPCFPIPVSAPIITVSWQPQRLLLILISSSFYSECKERLELQSQRWKARVLISELCSPGRSFQHFYVLWSPFCFCIYFYWGSPSPLKQRIYYCIHPEASHGQVLLQLVCYVSLWVYKQLSHASPLDTILV